MNYKKINCRQRKENGGIRADRGHLGQHQLPGSGNAAGVPDPPAPCSTIRSRKRMWLSAGWTAPLWRGTRKPTIEKDMHLAVYRNRPEVNAVVHTHPLYSMVYASQGKEIPQIIDEAAQVLGGHMQMYRVTLCPEALSWRNSAWRRWEKKQTPA